MFSCRFPPLRHRRHPNLHRAVDPITRGRSISAASRSAARPVGSRRLPGGLELHRDRRGRSGHHPPSGGGGTHSFRSAPARYELCTELFGSGMRAARVVLCAMVRVGNDNQARPYSSGRAWLSSMSEAFISEQGSRSGNHVVGNVFRTSGRALKPEARIALTSFPASKGTIHRYMVEAAVISGNAWILWIPLIERLGWDRLYRRIRFLCEWPGSAIDMGGAGPRRGQTTTGKDWGVRSM